MANTSDLSNDFANYIASKGLDVNNSPVSDINNCALCHADVDSFATPHQFALDFMAAGKNEAAFSTIENLDSDGDGTSNGDEILQGFFPGISCDDLAGGNPISDWPADKNIADFVDPAKPGCIDAAADIDVQPAALNFTTAITGASKPLTAVIINLGTADLTVTALNFDATTSSDFALGADVPALPVVIAPNGLVHVEVVYAPSDVGSDSGALMVVSDSPNEEDFPVSLFGEGVAPPNDCDIVSGPASHDFGAVTVGETAMQTFNLQNQGTLTDCIVDAITLGAVGS
ncbi:MAG: choice-of-anchor D domain-containing protein, partial [Nitrospinaceae bacterium]